MVCHLQFLELERGRNITQKSAIVTTCIIRSVHAKRLQFLVHIIVQNSTACNGLGIRAKHCHSLLDVYAIFAPDKVLRGLCHLLGKPRTPVSSFIHHSACLLALLDRGFELFLLRPRCQL